MPTLYEQIQDTLEFKASMTPRELAKALNTSEATIKFYLSKLKASGAVEVVGQVARDPGVTRGRKPSIYGRRSAAERRVA